MLINSYIGRNVEIVYQDSKGMTTTRRVAVYSVRNGKVRVLDWDKRAFGTLAAARILAAVPCAPSSANPSVDRLSLAGTASSMSPGPEGLSTEGRLNPRDTPGPPCLTALNQIQPLYSFTVHYIHRQLRS